jgi:hypothetical protein
VVKGPERETNYSTLPSAEVKDVGAVLILPNKSAGSGAKLIKNWDKLISERVCSV